MFSKHAGIYVRGLAMGAADIVPGVSGGTVAFITGIYQRLIDSIGAFNPATVKLLFQQGPASAWQRVDGTFLLMLFAGILTSFFSLASLISYLLEQHPLLVWSFFFGLIAASSWHIGRQINSWQLAQLAALLVGLGFALLVTELKPSQLAATPLNFFMAGAVAICAMILPGISGSFILVLLGIYEQVLVAIKTLQLSALLSFAAGCALGLLSFSQLLGWLFRHYRNTTMALLTGFLVGSLNLVWPWKHTLSYYTDRHGEQLALQQQNVLPAGYQQMVAADPQTIGCIGLMLLGLLVVILLERVGSSTA